MCGEGVWWMGVVCVLMCLAVVCSDVSCSGECLKTH